MPLNTQVKRNGKARKDLHWDGGEGNMIQQSQVAEAVLNAFLTTAMKEGDPELAYAGKKAFGDLEDGQFVDLTATGVYYIKTRAPLWKKGRQVLKRDHTYFAGSEYEITFRAGDELMMWRD